MEGVAETYVDVVGESSVTETPAVYSADLALQVIAPNNVKALEDMADLLKAVIRKLIGVSGLTSDQVIDGGADAWPIGGSDHLKGSKCVVQWIKIKSPEKKVLSRALNEIDGLFVDSHHCYSYRIRFPEFAAAAALKARALDKAIEDAKTKAMVIANAANINLGRVVRIMEMEEDPSGSEVFFDPSPDGRSTTPVQDPSGRLLPVERIRAVRCRVRFAIDPMP